MPSLAVFVADTHLNSRVAMCPLHYRFRGNGEFRPNKSQRAIHRRWKAAWDVVYEMQKELDAVILIDVHSIAHDVNIQSGI